MSARNFFTTEQKEDITIAIQNAELDTSGEIRVHVENTCKGDVKDQAAYLFEKLEISIMFLFSDSYLFINQTASIYFIHS